MSRLVKQLEQALSEDFAKGEIDMANLEKQTTELAQLYGKLRATHLAAHLEITPLLSDDQIQRYNFLRGYSK